MMSNNPKHLTPFRASYKSAMQIARSIPKLKSLQHLLLFSIVRASIILNSKYKAVSSRFLFLSYRGANHIAPAYQSCDVHVSTKKQSFTATARIRGQRPSESAWSVYWATILRQLQQRFIGVITRSLLLQPRPRCRAKWCVRFSATRALFVLRTADVDALPGSILKTFLQRFFNCTAQVDAYVFSSVFWLMD